MCTFMYFFQRNQTGEHGQNGLPAAKLVEVEYLIEKENVFLQSVLILTPNITGVLVVAMKEEDVMNTAVQVGCNS